MSPIGHRALLFIASIGYGASLLYCQSDFASVEWAPYGHSFGGLDSLDLVIWICAMALWSAVVPVRLRSPIDVILFVIYIAVCIPAIVVPLGLERVNGEQLHLLCLTVMLSFFACCLLAQSDGSEFSKGPARQCAPSLVYGMVGLWAVCLVILVMQYRSIMTLVSLDAIYEQRAAGAATSRGMGYLQTYFGYVLSPALLAFGLTARNALLITLGIAGGVVLYSITAEKNAFAFPFIIAAFHFCQGRSFGLARYSALLMAVLAVALGVSVTLYEDSPVAAFFAWYIGVRSLLTPGLFVAQYQEFFSDYGHTYFSHVTGLGAIFRGPDALTSNDRWPSLGHLVGEQYVGIPDLNANASFLASDGIASLGLPGIASAFLLLALFLIAFRRCALRIPRKFTMLVALPLGLLLSNGSLFTVFLSYGGLFWLLVMTAFFRDRSGTRAGLMADGRKRDAGG